MSPGMSEAGDLLGLRDLLKAEDVLFGAHLGSKKDFAQTEALARCRLRIGALFFPIVRRRYDNTCFLSAFVQAFASGWLQDENS